MFSLAMGAVVVLLACDDGAVAPPDTAVTPDGDDAAPTWHRDIQPLVAKHCGRCHTAGGVGPFALDTLDQTREYAPLMIGAMRAGVMPPWMPDPDCRRYQAERLVPDEDIARFDAWMDAAMPEGDPADAVEPPAVEVLTPTHSALISDAYTPTAEDIDDYRCFVLDLAFASDTYLTASQVVPGTSQVHHVLVYAIDGDQADAVALADASTEGPGYRCFGGPVPSLNVDQDAAVAAFFAGGELPKLLLPAQIASWVPGAVPRRYPSGGAMRIRAGSLVVAQVHYNLSEGLALADTTRLDLTLTDEAPDELVVVRPLAVRKLEIPAGEAEAVNVGWFGYYGEHPLELTSVAGHMHLLGVDIKADIVRGGQGGEATVDTSADECLLHIPRWDFHWQQSYLLRDDDPAILEPGDGVRVVCTYDNSADNQPVVGGVRQTPTDVTWGEGTTDEMCLLYYASVAPFSPAPSPAATPCERTQACAAACGDAPSFDCILACGQSDATCDLCALRAGLQCSSFACLPHLQAMSACLGGCLGSTVMLGSNTGRCLAAECGAQYEQLRGCIDGPLAADGCAAELEACGVGF